MGEGELKGAAAQLSRTKVVGARVGHRPAFPRPPRQVHFCYCLHTHRSGAGRPDTLQFLADLLPAPGAALPSPDAKASYTSVMAHVAMVNPDQTMYYLANPENGRKVVAQDGR